MDARPTVRGTDSQQASAGDSLEREKWDAERAWRERELRIREREEETKEAELALARAEHALSRWKSPLVVAILAAAVAAAGNALVAYTNAAAETKLAAQKSEQARILEMIKTGDPDAAAENLRFLVRAGLVTDPDVRRHVIRYLGSRTAGTGPVLPAGAGAANLVSQFADTRLTPYRDSLGVRSIGYGHVLTPKELKSHELRIGARRVDFRSGITATEAKRLLAQDLLPTRKRIKAVVKVKLTPNQLEALTTFVYYVGQSALRSGLLTKLNAGKYDEVPDEMMKWIHGGGRSDEGNRAQRRAEVALWNKP